MPNPTSVTKLLQDLVAIPSVNPAGDPGTPQVNEAAVAAYVGDFLKGLGAAVEIKDIQPGRPNVVAEFTSAGKARAHLALAPHTDTVSVLGMTISPFDPVIRNGKLYGRGASDTKGPMAAMLWALRDWSRRPARRTSRVKWTFAGLMGEEAGNEGAIALAQSGFCADLVIVGEPTRLKVIHAHKGALWLTITTRGKACHGSTPEKGSNAIVRMAEVLQRIEKTVGPRLRRMTYPGLGPVTLNTGTITGGSKVNIVPDYCRIECDVRIVPGHGANEVLAELRRALRGLVKPVDIAARRSPPPLATNPRNPWVEQLRRCGTGLATAPWFCDAAIFAREGIPSIAFGPGSIAQAHTKDEFIQVRDLEKGQQAFLKFLNMTS